MNELHYMAIDLLSDDYQDFTDLKPELISKTDYNDPFWLLLNLVDYGKADHKIVPLYYAGGPIGARNYFKLGSGQIEISDKEFIHD